MNSSGYPRWNSETCLWPCLLCGRPHLLWLPSHVSSTSGVSLVFLHSLCHYLGVVVDFLLVFIFPYLSLVNLFFFLCIATRAVLTQRPGDGDDDDDWYLLNTYCGRHSSYVLICIILLNLCNNLWGRYCYYPYFTSKTKDQRGKHLPEITQLNDRIGILIQPNSRVQALTTVHPPAKTS